MQRGAYELAIGIPGLVDDPAFSPVYDPSFDVVALPLGEWVFELRLRDAAGNESSLEFTVVIGEDPVRLDDGCQCASDSAPGSSGTALGALWLLGLVGLRRRRRQP